MAMHKRADQNYENLGPQVVCRVQKEIHALAKSPPDGVRYLPQDGAPICHVYAEITGPDGTPYAGGRFVVKLVLGNAYPGVAPRAFFLTRVYHPNVGPSGDVCVNTLKRDWTPDVTVSHVFQVIRCLLIQPFAESSLNDEAGRLFMESYDEFHRRAAVLTAVHAKPVKAGGDADETDETDETATAPSKPGTPSEAAAAAGAAAAGVQAGRQQKAAAKAGVKRGACGGKSPGGDARRKLLKRL
ncbi:ubiquitin-conjugating enzyme E2S [Tribonema minus]|uniref:E2 ubiquitin-conjugating enzyme n=1 Tax=Tribonema minus TaxID=303371 RepID=A0A836CMG0_9STRA|nr:ubiquitin-conjugating enzyme E2S [Tribonema minus]